MNSNTKINFSKLPQINHDIQHKEFENFLSIPQAKYIETELINGMIQLQARLMRPLFENKGVDFVKWEEAEYFHFKLVFSPNKNVIRLEVYDTMLFPILLEQIIENGFDVITSGEDVEFATIKTQQNGWLGWAHFIKS